VRFATFALHRPISSSRFASMKSAREGHRAATRRHRPTLLARVRRAQPCVSAASAVKAFENVRVKPRDAIALLRDAPPSGQTRRLRSRNDASTSRVAPAGAEFAARDRCVGGEHRDQRGRDPTRHPATAHIQRDAEHDALRMGITSAILRLRCRRLHPRFHYPGAAPPDSSVDRPPPAGPSTFAALWPTNGSGAPDAPNVAADGAGPASIAPARSCATDSPRRPLRRPTERPVQTLRPRYPIHFRPTRPLPCRRPNRHPVMTILTSITCAPLRQGWRTVLQK